MTEGGGGQRNSPFSEDNAVKQYYFLAAAVLFLAAARSVPAQIVYTDINPDTTVSATVDQIWKSYFLDMDNDGSFEFEIEHFHPEPTYQAVEIHRNMDGVHQVIIDAAGHARVMNRGESIGAASGSWGLDGYGILNAPWYGGADKYFAIRFQIDGTWHYGWARVSIPSDATSVTVKDYAYEATPGAVIECGNTGTTGSDTPPLVREIHIEQTGKRILITHADGGECAASVYTLLGISVYRRMLQGSQTTLDLSSLPRGAYLLALERGGQLLRTQRILL